MFFKRSRLNGALGHYWVVSSEALRYYLPFTKWLFYDRVTFVTQGIPVRLGALGEAVIQSFIPQFLSALIAGWLALMLIGRRRQEGSSSGA
jgi:hypothetical protein